MDSSYPGPATHAGAWMDQTARVYARSSGPRPSPWAADEELAMEQSLKRGRGMSIQLALINIEIRMAPRRPARPAHRLTRVLTRTALGRAVARDREATITRWMIGS